MAELERAGLNCFLPARVGHGQVVDPGRQPSRDLEADLIFIQPFDAHGRNSIQLHAGRLDKILAGQSDVSTAAITDQRRIHLINHRRQPRAQSDIIQEDINERLIVSLVKDERDRDSLADPGDISAQA